jgi:hypothetical protein
MPSVIHAFTGRAGLARCDGSPRARAHRFLLRPTSAGAGAADRLGWLALVGALALFFLIGVPLQMVNRGAGIWFTEVFLFFGFGWALVRWSGRSPVAYLGLSWPGGWPMAFALGIAVANYFAAVIPLQFLAQLVAPRSWVEMFDQTQVFERQRGLDLFLAMTGAVAAGADRGGDHLPRAAPAGAAPSRGADAAGGRGLGGDLQPLPRQPHRVAGAVRAGAGVRSAVRPDAGACCRGWWRTSGATSPPPCSTWSARGRTPDPWSSPRRCPLCSRPAPWAGWCWGRSSSARGAVPAAWGTPRAIDVVRPRVPSRGRSPRGPWPRACPSSSGEWPTAEVWSWTWPTSRSGFPPRARRSRIGCANGGPRWTPCATTSAAEAPRWTATSVPGRALAGAVERAGAAIQADPVD